MRELLVAVAAIVWIPAAEVGANAEASPRPSVAVHVETRADRDHRSVGHLTPEQKAWFGRTVERILEGRS